MYVLFCLVFLQQLASKLQSETIFQGKISPKQTLHIYWGFPVKSTSQMKCTCVHKIVGNSVSRAMFIMSTSKYFLKLVSLWHWRLLGKLRFLNIANLLELSILNILNKLKSQVKIRGKLYANVVLGDHVSSEFSWLYTPLAKFSMHYELKHGKSPFWQDNALFASKTKINIFWNFFLHSRSPLGPSTRKNFKKRWF